jgi:hypothetical protein
VRPRHLLATLLVLAPLALPGAAAADDFDEIFGDYRSDGKINGCYRPEALHNAGRDIPPDIEQYTPGFGDALGAAQSRCSSGGSAPEEAEEEPATISAGTPGPGAGAVTKRTVKEPPAPRAVEPPVVGNLPDPTLNTATAAVRSDTPGALIALLIAAGIAVVIALGWALAWLMGWSTERLTKPLAAAFQTVWDRLIPGR